MMVNVPALVSRPSHPRTTMLASIRPLALWHRLRRAKALRSSCGLELPVWALNEVCFSPVQAAWLQESICAWHARRAMAGWPSSAGQVSMLDLSVALAERQVRLRACRLSDAGALRRGDVAVFGLHPAQRLLGVSSDTGGGLALVIEAGSQFVRLRAAGQVDAVTCRTADLKGALLGWVLRSDPMLPTPSAGHGSAWSAAGCALAG
jgi:hypothetical protein